MNREEFYEWLDTCPTHKWEITYDDSEFISVSFPIEERSSTTLKEVNMEYTKKELMAMLETVRQKIAEQGRIVDARLLEKERDLEQAIKNLETER